MTDFSPLRVALEVRRIKAQLHRSMLDRSARSSETESENMEVPGEVTPPSLGSKEDKMEIMGQGRDMKVLDDLSPEIEKEKPKPRASVLEYKSVSQVYVFPVHAMRSSHEKWLFTIFSSWDKDSYGRKLVDSLEDSSKKKDKYEEYIFVVRRQYGASLCNIYLRLVLTLH